MSIEQRVAVVTGAAGGIGSRIVSALSEAGMCVVGADLDGADLVLDVTSRESVEAAAASVLAKHGRVDVLVNAAGIFRRTPAVQMEEGAMRAVLSVNLEGAMRCTAAFAQPMKKQGHGRIIHVGSIAGVTGAALASVYAASKAGLAAHAQSAARELGGHGVTINVVAPGYCDTAMLAAERAIIDKFTLPRIPMGRVAEAWEVAELVAFLATSRSSYMTGTVITFDGGLSVG